MRGATPFARRVKGTARPLACVLVLGIVLAAGTIGPGNIARAAEDKPGEVAPDASGTPYPSDHAARGPSGPEDSRAGGGIAQMFERGGVFMWPLLVLAIIAVTIIIERLYTLHRQRSDTSQLMGALIQSLKSGGAGAARELCLQTRGPIAAIIHAGLTKVERGPAAVERAIENAGAIEIAFLQRGLPALSAIAGLAPLLGFLGTVSGMIHAFDAIAATELVSMSVVARGIAEALLTTLAGLVIAIPAQAAHSYFEARIDRFVIEMEASSIELLDALVDDAESAR